MDAAKKEQFEQRAVLVLAGVFLVVFAIGPLKRMTLVKRYAPAAISMPVSPLGAAVDTGISGASGQVAAPSAEQPPVVVTELYTAQQLRDPMMDVLAAKEAEAQLAATQAARAATAVAQQPAQVPAPSARPSLHVQGVVWGGQRPTAIIDGKIYSVGDVVANRKIHNIDKNGVTLVEGGSTLFYPVSDRSAGSGDQHSQQAQWR